MNASLFPKLLKKHYLLPLARQLSRRPQVPSPSMKTIAMNELRSTTRNLHQQQNLKEKNGRIRNVFCPAIITTPAVGDLQRDIQAYSRPFIGEGAGTQHVKLLRTRVFWPSFLLLLLDLRWCQNTCYVWSWRESSRRGTGAISISDVMAITTLFGDWVFRRSQMLPLQEITIAM